MSTRSSSKRKADGPADTSTTPKDVFVVTRLHYRNDDRCHNYATVAGVFNSETKAIEFLDKTYLDTLKDYEGVPVETSSNGNRRIISEQTGGTADTDEFDIECHKIQ